MSGISRIEVSNVTVRYPLQWSLGRHLHNTLSGRRNPEVSAALQNVSFSIESGTRLGVMGGNGAGKTTLLKTVSGIYRPASGMVKTVGEIARLFDLSVGFNGELSGRQNVVRKMRLLGADTTTIEERIGDVLEFAALGSRIDLPLRTYSSGMRMRLAFSAATACKPDILLMDEWIGASDREFIEKVQERLNSFAMSANIVVLASHSLRLMGRVCDKGLVLKDGQIEYFGDIEPAISAYENIAQAGKQVTAEAEKTCLQRAAFHLNQARAREQDGRDVDPSLLKRARHHLDQAIRQFSSEQSP